VTHFRTVAVRRLADPHRRPLASSNFGGEDIRQLTDYSKQNLCLIMDRQHAPGGV
jgi:hypothetical protein